MKTTNLFKETFDQMQPSQRCVDQILSMAEQPTRRRHPRTASLVLAAMLVLCLGVTASAAAGRTILRQFHSYTGAVDTYFEDDDGTVGVEGTMDTDNLTAPAELRSDGRIYFTADGQNIDITDKISDTKAFIYHFSDKQGSYYLIVGGTPDTLGWAEFDKDTDGEWIGGNYSGGTSDAPDQIQWLQSAKEELGVPW